MKNLFLTGAVMMLLFSSCKEGEKNESQVESEVEAAIETVEQVADCDANSAESAATCLCDLVNKRDNSDLTDEEYNEVQSKIDQMNGLIDAAIASGKYNDADLNEVAAKLDCNF